MQRKLIKQGLGGFTIYLPKKWLDKKGLKEGSSVEVEELEEDIIIYSNKLKKNKAEITLNIKKSTESAARTIITNAYRLGYDKVKVNFNDNKQFKLLNKTIRNQLLGFEITKKEKDFCIVESITEPSTEQFDILIQKVFYNSLELIKITKKRLNKQEVEEDYNEVEERIKQYDNFCRRTITKKRFQRNSQLFWTFLTLIVHAQREFYMINKWLDNNKCDTNKKVIAFLEEIEKMVRDIIKSYSKKEVKLLEEIHTLEKDLIHKKAEILFKEFKHPMIVHRLASSARKYYLATSPLIGIII